MITFGLFFTFCPDRAFQDLLDTTMEQLEEFALEGLRTLMLGTKEMPEEEFAEWDEVGSRFMCRSAYMNRWTCQG